MILRTYNLLLTAYGPQHWWPGETRDEIIIGAVLTQNTNWRNVERAIFNLAQAHMLSLESIAQAETAAVARLVRPSGYYNQKAERLQRLAANLGDIASMDTAAARSHLLAQKGVGPETADSILLYAFGHPCFVIDAYTRRIGARLGLIPARDDYDGWRELFVVALPQDTALYNEYHALLVRQAKLHCGKTPRCDDCPLLDLCAHGAER